MSFDDLTMLESESLDHLARIGRICEDLAGQQVLDEAALGNSFDTLTAFDQQFWTFTRYLSLPLYEETSALLQQEGQLLTEAPRIAVVMAVYRPNPQLLRLAIRSALEQVGVRVHLYLSLDGPEGNASLVQEVLTELDTDPEQLSVITQPENRGVGLTRNAALAQLQEEWYTFLDCDDIFHPLRLLHAWLVMKNHNISFLNTSYSRVSLHQKKIVLLQQSLSSVGGNSFLAHRSVLNTYGYLAPLRFWEDTEYQQRLRHFGLTILSTHAIGHFQNTDLTPSYRSLATRWRQEAHTINDHPWLCGTVLGEIDEETLAIRNHFQSLYPRLTIDQLPAVFPPGRFPAGHAQISP